LPQHKSALKKVKVDKRRRARNRAIRSKLRTEIKRLRTLINGKETDLLEEQLKRTISIIDKTRSKGVIHRNHCARLKSRLTKHVNDLLSVS